MANTKLKDKQAFVDHLFTKKWGFNFRPVSELEQKIQQNKRVLTNNPGHFDKERIEGHTRALEAEIAERAADTKAYGEKYDNLSDSFKAALRLGALSVSDIELQKQETAYNKFIANLDPATKSLIDAGKLDGASLYEEMTGKKAATNAGLSQQEIDNINKGFEL